MDITITGRHLDITPAIREYAHQKLSKLPRYFDRVQLITAVADKSGKDYLIEVIVEADKADPFVCKTEGGDLYACIDEAVDKLERQLTDHKEKLRNRKHSGTR